MTRSAPDSLPQAGSSVGIFGRAELHWLLDAPMFIDAKGVARLYDSVVRPAHDEGDRRIQVQRETELGASLNGEGQITAGSGKLWESLGLFKAEVTGKVGGGVTGSVAESQSQEIILKPIVTPERRLVQVTLMYLSQHLHRVALPRSSSDNKWWEGVGPSPRKLVFIDLPGTDECPTLPLTIIPTVAEFGDGKFEWIYKKLTDKIKAEYSNVAVPDDPDGATDLAQRRELEQRYWAFFADTAHFRRGRHAMEAVEEASTHLGRIQWIDYRLPLDTAGNTLHLHVCPDGEYDTGVFAYQFIRRGYKHGLRIVGTLKSGPALDVLAVFEK